MRFPDPALFMDEKPPQKRFTHLLKSINLWAVILALLLALGLVLDWRWLRGNDEYRWRYYSLPGIEGRVWLTAVICVAVGLLCYFLISWAAKRGSRKRTWAIISLLFLAALALQLAMLRLDHPDPMVTLFYRTVSTRNLGAFYFDSTTTTDIGQRLRDFPALMPDFNSLSPRTHPPGLQVLFWSTAQSLSKMPFLADRLGPALRTYLCNDPAASPIFFYPNNVLASSLLQLLMPLWAALTIFPFYGLARQLFNRETAVRGAVLLILAPSMALFAAHWAHFYTLLALIALYFLYRGLLSWSWWPMLLAGLLVSAATFLSFSNLTLVALMGITIVVYWFVTFMAQAHSWSKYLHDNWRIITIQMVAFALGGLSVWLVYYLRYGVTFIEVYSQGLLSHTDITGYRTYWIWLGYNLFDFFLFLGIPLVIATIMMIFRQFSRRSGAARYVPQTIPFWAFTFTILALNLSGISKGEVARLWMFLVPLAILAILPVVAEWTRRQVAVAIAVLIFQLIFMGYYIRTIGSTNYPYYVPRPVETAVPAGVEQTAVDFSGEEIMTLTGYDLAPSAPEPGDVLELTLFWQAAAPLQHSYTVFVHLVDPISGEIVAQHDSLPREGALPTTCWQPGEAVGDDHPLMLDPALPPGDYLLQMGVYRLDLLQAGDPNHRLPLDADGEISTVLDVTTIQVGDP